MLEIVEVNEISPLLLLNSNEEEFGSCAEDAGVGVGVTNEVDSWVITIDSVLMIVEVCGSSDDVMILEVTSILEVDSIGLDALVWFPMDCWRRSSKGKDSLSTMCCLLDVGTSNSQLVLAIRETEWYSMDRTYLWCSKP